MLPTATLSKRGSTVIHSIALELIFLAKLSWALRGKDLALHTNLGTCFICSLGKAFSLPYLQAPQDPAYPVAMPPNHLPS